MIGTFGWKDENGLIRYYDYIADEKGFRIIDQQEEFDDSELGLGKLFKTSDRFVELIHNSIETGEDRRGKVMRLRRKRKLKSRGFPKMPPGFPNKNKNDPELQYLGKQQDPIPYSKQLLLANQFPRYLHINVYHFNSLRH